MNKTRTIFFGLVLTACSLLDSLSAQTGEKHTIWFDKPCPKASLPAWGEGDISPAEGSNPKNKDPYWEQASLPVGNGSLGANVFGSISEERLTLNEKTLWRGGPNTSKGADYYWNVNKHSAPVLKEIRQAILEGDEEKAAQLTRDHFNSTVPYEADAENPFRFGSFTTAGELHIATGLDEKQVTDYVRSLSLDSALATVSFACNGVRYQRRFFVSYPDQVLVARFTADRKQQQNLTFSYLPNPLSTGRFRVTGKHEISFIASLDNNHMNYVVRIRVLTPNGKVKANKDGHIRIEGADEAVFLITADTDYAPNFDPDFSNPRTYVGNNPQQTTAVWMETASEKGYGDLFRRHFADYSALFGRCDLKLNPAFRENETALPTPERLQRYRTGAPDYGLEALYFQYGRYLLIASSRPGNLPANLQGIWHNQVDGPWRVDYHNNINVQMNYWPACLTNLPECELPLFDYIRTLVKPGARTARDYFGARGWTASISSNIFGFTTPLRDKDMSWNLIPMSGPWLATHLWDYYDYTRDLEFLRNSGYELIKGAARFTVDYLWKKPDGTYTAAPSTSPEHGPIDEGATFAHAVAREILSDAIEASQVLHTDETERRQWEEVLQNLAPYRIGRYGQLMEWSKDIDDPTDRHRHVNHLFGLHPGHTISPSTTPRLAQAARVVLEHRGDGATGWSTGWKLNQWARLHDGNRAYTLFRNLLSNSTHDNLWDSHPPFQIDGNFDGTAGIAGMLVQSQEGFIHLLPALPDVWHEGQLTGIRARGNFVLDLAWKDNNLVSVLIHSGSGVPCRLRYKDQMLEFPTEPGQSYELKWENGKWVSDF